MHVLQPTVFRKINLLSLLFFSHSHIYNFSLSVYRKMQSYGGTTARIDRIRSREIVYII